MQYGGSVRGFFTQIANGTLEIYLDAKKNIELTITEHFNQKETIKELRQENGELQESAELLNAFAGRLNDLLKLKGAKEYAPKIDMVRSVAYAKLNDYHKVWIEYEDFNASKIYGLIHNGKSAGIVIEKNGNPLGLLMGDPNSIFSVYVGEEKIPGVVVGKKKEVHVKYIPLWMNPKVGDEVVTSGLDGIFFKGVRVGKVVDVIKEELSKTAIIKPYMKNEVPSYYYIIKEK